MKAQMSFFGGLLVWIVGIPLFTGIITRELQCLFARSLVEKNAQIEHLLEYRYATGILVTILNVLLYSYVQWTNNRNIECGIRKTIMKTSHPISTIIFYSIVNNVVILSLVVFPIIVSKVFSALIEDLVNVSDALNPLCRTFLIDTFRNLRNDVRMWENMLLGYSLISFVGILMGDTGHLHKKSILKTIHIYILLVRNISATLVEFTLVPFLVGKFSTILSTPCSSGITKTRIENVGFGYILLFWFEWMFISIKYVSRSGIFYCFDSFLTPFIVKMHKLERFDLMRFIHKHGIRLFLIESTVFVSTHIYNRISEMSCFDFTSSRVSAFESGFSDDLLLAFSLLAYSGISSFLQHISSILRTWFTSLGYTLGLESYLLNDHRNVPKVVIVDYINVRYVSNVSRDPIKMFVTESVTRKHTSVISPTRKSLLDYNLLSKSLDGDSSNPSGSSDAESIESKYQTPICMKDEVIYGAGVAENNACDMFGRERNNGWEAVLSIIGYMSRIKDPYSGGSELSPFYFNTSRCINVPAKTKRGDGNFTLVPRHDDILYNHEEVNAMHYVPHYRRLRDVYERSGIGVDYNYLDLHHKYISSRININKSSIIKMSGPEEYCADMQTTNNYSIVYSPNLFTLRMIAFSIVFSAASILSIAGYSAFSLFLGRFIVRLLCKGNTDVGMEVYFITGMISISQILFLLSIIRNVLLRTWGFRDLLKEISSLMLNLLLVILMFCLFSGRPVTSDEFSNMKCSVSTALSVMISHMFQP